MTNSIQTSSMTAQGYSPWPMLELTPMEVSSSSPTVLLLIWTTNIPYFGYVVEGQKVVDTISQNDKIESVKIIRVGKKAEEWDALAAFEKFNAEKQARIEAEKRKQQEALAQLTEGFEKTASGLYYKITEKGNGKKPKKGDQVAVHYTGMLLDGKVFDSSLYRGQPLNFAVGIGQVIEGWDEGILLLNEGDKARLVIPSDLAYGSQGAGGVIPPNAALVFDVELVRVL